ncbi:hypothetical protein SEA_CAMERICO_33 [Gordonia phage Camerico]|nr:hypothetical protein SEA_CAMERICO_33 [Gordonia phage Camerico]
MATEYRQFIVDELISNELIWQTKKDVEDNIHATLAADDDPSNDGAHVEIDMSYGTDVIGRRGLWITGRAEADPRPYPQPASRSNFLIDGAVRTVNDSHEPTDFDADDEDYAAHMANKWGA